MAATLATMGLSCATKVMDEPMWTPRRVAICWEMATSGLVSEGFHHWPSTRRGARGKRVVPCEVDGAQGSAGEVLELEVGGGDSIDRVDARGGYGEEFGFG